MVRNAFTKSVLSLPNEITSQCSTFAFFAREFSTVLPSDVWLEIFWSSHQLGITNPKNDILAVPLKYAGIKLT